ncbi:hypothetical protein LUZ60_016308 [Juncus effusus]|nr:hypothetical protein LUZ60_016308 [Juncus effusus]
MISMKRGNEQDSYANNSDFQAISTHSIFHFLEETLDKLPVPLPDEEPFVIADLGCAFGKNAIDNVDFIINHVKRMCEFKHHKTPEFQVILSDLPSNDFNALFNLLTLEGKNQEYFVAGVPGSFYDRLFPSKSINVFHSTFSLHWLSQVPKEVMDIGSTAYNKGLVSVHGASEATGAAYKRQFMSDLSRFLEARAHEIKHGGVMYLVCMGRISADTTDQAGTGDLVGTHFQDAWKDLIKEGLIGSEKRDKFNVPFYAPTVEEFKEAIEANGLYHVKKLELNVLKPSAYDWPDDEQTLGKLQTRFCRMLIEELVKSSIGEELTEELFVRMEKRAVHGEKITEENMGDYLIVCSLSFP